MVQVICWALDMLNKNKTMNLINGYFVHVLSILANVHVSKMFLDM